MKRIFEKILNQEINDSHRIYENRQLLNEALTQKQKREVLDYIKENKFFPLDGGNNFYFIVPVDNEHIEMTPEFEEQLEREGLYGRSYISGILSSSDAELPIGMVWLPINGSSNRYVTKWIEHSYDDCFDRDLKDRQVKLSKRLDIEKIK